ncbi:MAG: hypothetical protein WBD22_14735 [Pyrinomonadaceae bacterium]
MKRSFAFNAFVIVVSAAVSVLSQNSDLESTSAPLTVVINENLPAPRHIPTPTPWPDEPDETPVSDNDGSLYAGKDTEPIVVGRERIVTAAAQPVQVSQTKRSLSFAQIKRKIAEAKRDMQARPMPTALTESALSTDWVRIAFHDWKTNRIDYVVMSKVAFLSTTSDKLTMSSNGRSITVRTLRSNYTNTPVAIMDETGQMHLPLMVQYPIEKFGKHVETAYYLSTHPGLVTPEVVNAGKFYVRNVLELARGRLKSKGIFIQPKVTDMAERLSLVEHVDHDRFRNEPHPNVYNDVYALYALNEGSTYRYSVSSAGAGGMVQMIPSTYRMVRAWHPNVGLNPDFVEGMRDHVNATQAMLLYMQRTWNDLVASPTVAGAITDGIATPEQLMAAGYNSNPARLARYISRGGADWTSLIPRETKVYLQILSSVELHVPMNERTR